MVTGIAIVAAKRTAVHAKSGQRRLVEILQHREKDHDLGDLVEAVMAMPPMEGEVSDALDFNDAGSALVGTQGSAGWRSTSARYMSVGDGWLDTPSGSINEITDPLISHFACRVLSV